MKPNELSMLYDQKYIEYNQETITELLTDVIDYSLREGVSKQTINVPFQMLYDRDLDVGNFESFLKENGYAYSKSNRGNCLKPNDDGVFVLDLSKV